MGIYFGGLDFDNPAEQSLVVESSIGLYLLRQSEFPNQVKNLRVEGKENFDIACVSFFDDVLDEVKNEWTADIAFRLCEKMGRISGDDQQNWHEAERLIEEVTKPFIQY